MPISQPMGTVVSRRSIVRVWSLRSALSSFLVIVSYYYGYLYYHCYSFSGSGCCIIIIYHELLFFSFFLFSPFFRVARRVALVVCWSDGGGRRGPRHTLRPAAGADRCVGASVCREFTMSVLRCVVMVLYACLHSSCSLGFMHVGCFRSVRRATPLGRWLQLVLGDVPVLLPKMMMTMMTTTMTDCSPLVSVGPPSALSVPFGRPTPRAAHDDFYSFLSD